MEQEVDVDCCEGDQCVVGIEWCEEQLIEYEFDCCCVDEEVVLFDCGVDDCGEDDVVLIGCCCDGFGGCEFSL